MYLPVRWSACFHYMGEKMTRLHALRGSYTWLVLPFLFAATACGTAETNSETDASANQGMDTNTEESNEPWVEPELDISSMGTAWERPAAVHVPASYTAREAWPLVILLHGFRASGFVQDSYLGFSNLVDDRGFILIIPDGTENPEGQRFWNATEACCDFYGEAPDDAGYLLHLIDQAQERYNVNAGQVFLAGHSNGGFMAHRMACDHADRITGIMSLAGSTFINEDRCNNSEPVAMLQVHGTADSTIPYEGNNWYPGAEETTSRWRTKNACGAAEELESIAIENALAGNETRVLSGQSCAQNLSAELWTIDGGSHIPAFNRDFAGLVIDFFLAHEKAK